MSLDKNRKKRGKKKSRKTAKDFGDKTPADYNKEIKAIRKAAAKKVKIVEKRKTRSISADRAGRHKEQSWEKAHQKKKAKRFGIDMF